MTTEKDMSSVQFNFPEYITVDRTGENLFVADASTHAILKIVINTGEVTTLAGSPGVNDFADGTGSAARFHAPAGMVVDSTGTNLYLADACNETIRKIVVSTGEVTTLAGSKGLKGFVDGVGSAARFNNPRDVAIDSAETNLYVADNMNCTIRKIVINTGEVITLAGSPGVHDFANGARSTARFNCPMGVVVDSTGTNLYVADTNNCAIRKIEISTGEVTTLAGSETVSEEVEFYGSADGTGSAARFYSPRSIAIDRTGTNLYVADTENSIIRKIVISTGKVTTLAGSAGVNDFADGIGPAARFHKPQGVTVDSTETYLYVADTCNNAIRKIEISTGKVTTIVGSATKDVINNPKKSCFIATAVYGSDLAPEVIVLRNFRDQMLIRYLLGRWFVTTYYAVSPPLAVLIKRTWVLKSIVKLCILSPLLRVIKIMVRE